MKKINLFLATALLCGVGFISCVNETEMTENDVVKNATRSVVFNIQFPSGDPYHITRVVGDFENDLTSLYLLTFDASTDKLVGAPTDIAGATLDATYNGTTFTYTYDATNSPAMAYRFMLVANEDVTDFTDGTAMSTVESRILTKTALILSNTNKAEATAFAGGLPMFGIATLAGQDHEIIPLDNQGGGATVAVDVTMTRIVARIDVVNKAEGLTITKLALKHANPNGYLKPHIVSSKVQIPTSMTKVDGIEPYTALPTGGLLGPVSAPDPANKLEKAFYVYEEEELATANIANALTLQVTGNISGVPVFYEVPFIDANLETPANNNLGIELKRNHIYTVNIGDNTPVTVNTRVRMTFSVAQWENGDELSKNYSPELFVSNDAPADYDVTTQVFEVDNTAHAALDLHVAAQYTAVEIEGVEVMLTNIWSTKVTTTTGQTGAAGDWLRVTYTDTKNLVIEVAANTSGAARTGSIRVTYKNSSGVSGNTKVFSVKQAA